MTGQPAPLDMRTNRDAQASGAEPRKIDIAKHISEYGSPNVKVLLVVDALSVFAAVTALSPKTPAEKGLLVHLRWLREQLELRRCAAIIWIDTRDMLADALTKGSVDRAELHHTMEKGVWVIIHEVKR